MSRPNLCQCACCNHGHAEVAALREECNVKERAIDLALGRTDNFWRERDEARRDLAEARALVAGVTSVAEEYHGTDGWRHNVCSVCDRIEAARAFLRGDEARRCECDKAWPERPRTSHLIQCPDNPINARDEARGAAELGDACTCGAEQSHTNDCNRTRWLRRAAPTEPGEE